MLERIGKYILPTLLLVLAGGAGWGAHGVASAQIRVPFLERTAPLQVRVVEADTEMPLAGAEVVIAETGVRLTTGADGWTPEVRAPILRDPRLSRRLAEFHGQLTLIAYKNGYRDTLYFGVRMHDGVKTDPEIWMYPLSAEDQRIEPMAYVAPLHRIWRLQLAEEFRSESQPGEGPESPER